MRKSIDTIREVKARETLEKERQQKAAARQSASSSPDPSSPSTPAASSHLKRSSNFTVFCLKIAAAMIFIIGTVFGANEAMVFLLK